MHSSADHHKVQQRPRLESRAFPNCDWPVCSERMVSWPPGNLQCAAGCSDGGNTGNTPSRTSDSHNHPPDSSIFTLLFTFPVWLSEATMEKPSLRDLVVACLSFGMEHVHIESCITVRSFDKHSFFSPLMVLCDSCCKCRPRTPFLW